MQGSGSESKGRWGQVQGGWGRWMLDAGGCRYQKLGRGDRDREAWWDVGGAWKFSWQ